MPRISREASGRARPFVKWAGGKTQLLSQFEDLFPAPDRLRRYLEPFVGSGAVYFHLRERLGRTPVILADGNVELINVYTIVRDDVEGLIRALRRHQSAHSEAHYYKVRGLLPSKMKAAARAARFIYLNRTCFNGLYRVNAGGAFNVPMGRYADPGILDAGNLRACSAALRGVTLRVSRFGETLRYARPKDFIYFDPPYLPVSATSFFTSYAVNEGRSGFGVADQEELAEVYAKLARRGCFVMLSNSDGEIIRSLYRSFDIHEVKARRNINSKADRRGKIGEIVVLNYEPGEGPAVLTRTGRKGQAARPPDRPIAL